MNPFVFLVGCPRSGTTVLQRLCNAHPDLSVIGELHWVPRWWQRRHGVAGDGTVTPDLARRLTRHAHFARLGVSAGDVKALVDARPPKQYAEFVTELFDLHGSLAGKRHVGVKTPQYVLHIETLRTLWPEAKFVHLIRDGRDVALSLLDWSKAQRSLQQPPWNEDPVVSTALFWESHVRLGRESGPVLGTERYLEVRYEGLVADPEPECRRLCEFLGLDYDPRMLHFHEGRRKPDGLSAKKAWLPVTPGLRDWRDEMSAGTSARFESVAGDLLDELGYPRAADPADHPSDAEVAHVDRLRAAFIEDARSRREAVPSAWQAVAA